MLTEDNYVNLHRIFCRVQRAACVSDPSPFLVSTSHHSLSKKLDAIKSTHNTKCNVGQERKTSHRYPIPGQLINRKVRGGWVWAECLTSAVGNVDGCISAH